MASAAIMPDARPVRRAARPATPRQRLWRALRQAEGPRSLPQLFDEAAIEPELFFSLIDNWSARGAILTLVQPLRFIMTDAARTRVNPPHVFASKPKSSVPKFSGRQRLWAAMRVLKEFDLPTICMAAEVSERSATDFLSGLGRIGYVSVLPQLANRPLMWRLIRNTGPKHPVLRHRVDGLKSVIELDDRNDGKQHRHLTDLAPWRAVRAGKRPSDDGGVS